MRGFISRSIVVKSALSIFALIVTLTSILTGYSYVAERGIYYNELTELHKTLTKQVEIELEGIIGAEAKLNKLAPAEYLKDENIEWISDNLNNMVRDGFISNSYLLLPKDELKDGKTYKRLLHANTEFIKDSGVQPGQLYILPDEWMQTEDELLRDGFAISDVYRDLGGKWITTMTTLHNEKKEVVALFAVDFNYDTIDAELDAILWKTAGVGVAVGLAIMGVMILLIRRMVGPLKQLTQISQEAAQGDLTVSVSNSSKDEIGQLAQSFNQMVQALRKITADVRETTEQVTVSAEQLTIISDQNAQSAQHVAAAVEEVATGSNTHLATVEDSKIAMEEVSIGIQRIAESALIVSEMSSDASATVEQGSDMIKQTIEQMNRIQEAAQQSSEQANQLAGQSQQIEAIVSSIQEIAGQTNLLALNASIEAARAGEHGRGFAVVAQEVRKLAEQTGHAAEQIGAQLQNVIVQTKQLSITMERSAGETQAGTKIARDAGKQFQSLHEAVHRVAEHIQEVSAASEEMSAGTEQVSASMNGLAAIAKDAADNAQSIAASSEEQLASVEEMASTAAWLGSKMKEMNAEMQKFKL
ncbi:methyl-accepting chemotaxis protein [Paenibacillus sp. SC116]|uniref:methyl-accepting chemotaxis protein n=1 Tax=Paenibacillus sp. SC116 TaxID=2968986 RepID=UPI00215B073B|nr:methyl-accepting chemotaxis protein [Paenibacillus sp. SC116]MCR8844625.1 methyl-accepting chemotaxis protein [Paenibacillus sp. SC116]